MKEPDHVKKQATKSVAEMVVSNLTPFSSIDGEGIEMTHKMYHTKITAIKLIKKKTGYALDFTEYGNDAIVSDVDKVCRFDISDFSTKKYHAEECMGDFDVLKFCHDQSTVYPKLSKLVR